MARVTLEHVAEQVGVDRSTVSRALRNKSGEVGISAALTGRIVDAARRLNYSPNASARAVRSGRFDAAALLMSTQAGRSYLSTRMLDGIHDALADQEMHLTIAKVPDQKLYSENYVPKILREFLSDGLIINYTHQLPPHLEEVLERCRLPFVWLNADVIHDGVRADSKEAGQSAAERLVLAGHSRIVYVDFCAGEDELLEAHGSAIERELGYETALLGFDLEPRTWRPPTALCPLADKVAFFRRKLRERPRPTALVCYFSHFVPALLQACALEGLTVPRDLSVITFAPELYNDAGVIVDMYVEPDYEMGRRAVSMLLQRIAEPGRRLATETLHFEFVSQGSIGPPLDG